MKKTFFPLALLMILSLSWVTTANAQENTRKFNLNRVSIGVIDMAFGDVSVKYERLLGNGQAGIFVPVNVSFYDGGMYDYDNTFYSGIGLNYYPTGQGVWKYFCGLEFNAGYGTFYHSDNYYDPLWGYYQWHDEEIDGIYTRFLINNGVIYSPTREFSADFHLGLGFRNAFIDRLTQDEQINPNATINITLSYRF